MTLLLLTAGFRTTGRGPVAIHSDTCLPCACRLPPGPIDLVQQQRQQTAYPFAKWMRQTDWRAREYGILLRKVVHGMRQDNHNWKLLCLLNSHCTLSLTCGCHSSFYYSFLWGGFKEELSSSDGFVALSEEFQLPLGPQQMFSKCSGVLSSGFWLTYIDFIYSLVKYLLGGRRGAWVHTLVSSFTHSLNKYWSCPAIN